MVPPISGFWRRFLAWIVDVLILGVLGQVFGLLFASFLFSIGPYGRPIGLLFILPYFGILNSRIGGGQTLGKRVMKIAVRNARNEPIEVWRSLIRISILALPSLFNGWAIPLFQNTIMAWIASLIVFGLGGAIIYTMVFNKNARQGIHDLLVGTYVVHLAGEPVAAFPKTRRIHWIITGVWLGIVALGSLAMVLLTPSMVSDTRLAPVMHLHDTLQKDPRFFTVSVTDQTVYAPNGETNRVLIITAWYKGAPDEHEQTEVVTSIIKTTLENMEDIHQYDRITVKITSAYDIGIASAHIARSFSDSVEGWRKQIYGEGLPLDRMPLSNQHAFAVVAPRNHAFIPFRGWL